MEGPQLADGQSPGAQRDATRRVAGSTEVTTSYPTSWARRIPARIVRVIALFSAVTSVRVLTGRARFVGREHLERVDVPVVLAANHSSHLDTPFILSALPLRHRHRTVVVAAADYFYADWLRATFVSLMFGTIPVERDEGASSESTARMHRLLETRWNLLLYPEGTRSRDGDIGELHLGAARFAIEHEIPLVPIGVTGTHASLPPGSWWPRRSNIVVRMGSPLQPAGDAQELTARLDAALRALTAT